MSNIGYFSDIFHNLGDLAIELNDSLNLLVRSYRIEIGQREKKEAEKMLLTFLALEEDKIAQFPWPRGDKIKEILNAFLAKKKGTLSKLKMIHQNIYSGKRISKSDVQLLDDLISQINQEATIAFRKMRKIA